MGRHKLDPDAAAKRAADDGRRITQLEQQLTTLSGCHHRLGTECEARARIIRSRNRQIYGLTEALRRLLLTYGAAVTRPERVLDTGTPGVEVGQ